MMFAGMINHGRAQRQEGIGRSRETIEREDLSIITSALRESDSSLSSILQTTGSSVTARTINYRLREVDLSSGPTRNWFFSNRKDH